MKGTIQIASVPSPKGLVIVVCIESYMQLNPINPDKIATLTSLLL
jgi:hypothetical protein